MLPLRLVLRRLTLRLKSVCENREKPPALKRMIHVEILSPER